MDSNSVERLSMPESARKGKASRSRSNNKKTRKSRSYQSIVSSQTSPPKPLRKTLFQKSASQASMLKHMKSKPRKVKDAKYKNKLEQIVRRQDKQEEPEPASTCCFCDAMVSDTALDCTKCDNIMPNCIVTGQHMTESDWSFCNRCNFPAKHSDFVDWYETERCCPMCGEITPNDIIQVDDATAYIKKYKQQTAGKGGPAGFL